MIGIESVIKPLRPPSEAIGLTWIRWPLPPNMEGSGFPCERWYYSPQCIQVMSAVEVMSDNHDVNRGPEYHISISCIRNKQAARVDSQAAQWVLNQFGLAGSEEDNHVPGGVVRNFWRTVAEPLIGLECECKANEPAMAEDKGDFVWRGVTP